MGPNEPTTYYFGPRWDAPLLDGKTQQLDTPIGRKCLYCPEPVADGDRGLFRIGVTGTAEKPVSTMEPVHMECDLRAGLGNVTHMQGRCGHTGGCNDQETGSWREQGRAVLDYVNRQRGRQGLPPM